MSRQVSLEIARAFRDGRRITRKNTTCTGDHVYLFGNTIAWRDEQGAIWLDMCGYGSLTTRERLNTICAVFGVRVGFHQCRGEQFYDGAVIDPNVPIMMLGRLGALAVKLAA